jgi:hypothetical protein
LIRCRLDKLKESQNYAAHNIETQASADSFDQIANEMDDIMAPNTDSNQPLPKAARQNTASNLFAHSTAQVYQDMVDLADDGTTLRRGFSSSADSHVDPESQYKACRDTTDTDATPSPGCPSTS